MMMAEGVMDNTGELALVKKAQNGDRDSYGRLVDQYGGVVLAIAYSRVGNYAASQDIAQDAFLLGFRNLSTLRNPQLFGTWLRTITRNLCRNWLKSQAYRDRLGADSAVLRERLGYVQAPEASAKLEEKEMHDLIDRILRKLPLSDRESIMLYYFEGKSMNEAAKALEISPATMRKRLERARKRLREQLSAHVESGLLEAAKGRTMSGRVLAAIPLGASYVKVAPVTSVVPATAALHLIKAAETVGGTAIGIGKAGLVATTCAVVIIGAGAVYTRLGNRPIEGPPVKPVELVESAVPEQTSAELRRREDSIRRQAEPMRLVEVVNEGVEEMVTGPPSLGKGDAVLYGRVTHAGGEPGREVKVIAGRTHDARGNEQEDVGAAETVTLQDGSYRLENLPDGRYVIYAIAPDATGVELVPVSSRRAGGTRQDIRISPSFATSGTVRNGDGVPVAGATVVLLARKDTPVDPVIFRPVSVETDQDGRYVLDYLWEGSYTVQAAAEGYAPSVIQDVRAGTSRNDIVLYPGGRVSGTVTFADTGEPVPEVLVVAKDQEGGKTHKGRTDEAGNYLLDNLSWDTTYSITVDGDVYAPQEEQKVRVRHGTDARGVDIVVSSGASISGTVTARDTGEPLSGATISVRGPKTREVTTGGDGTYLCTGLTPGLYNVYCEPPEGVVQEYGRQRQLSVHRDEQLTGVNFRFKRGATISGRVTDRAMNAVAGAHLEARCQAQTLQSRSGVKSDANGYYILAGIPRGATCRMYIRANRYGSIISDPVSVPADANLTGIDFVLGLGATISGRIVDRNGRPVENAQVQLLTDSGNTFWSTTVSTDADERGRFEFTDVGPGTYTFGGRAGEGGAFLTVLNDAITVRAGGDIPGVELVVEEPVEGVVEGYVRNEEGEGILSVLVQADPNAAVETDVTGHYRLEGLGDSTVVQIRFEHERYARASLSDLPVGTMNADVVMLRPGGIAGVVMDAATGQPVSDFSVQKGLGGRAWYGNPEHFHSRAGEFVLKSVEPGVVGLRISAAGYAPHEVSDIVVESGRVTDGIKVSLTRGNIIRGKVVAASDSRPIAGANIYLGAVPESGVAQMRDMLATTGMNGSFLLKDIGAGEQTLAVMHADFATATAVVDVREGQDAEVTIPLEVGGIVSGYVTENGEPVSGAFLGLHAGGEDPVWPSVSTDADGHYEISNIAPGTYTIGALVPGSEPGERALTERAVIEVRSGCITDRDFEFRTGTAVIEGTLMWNGEPLADPKVPALVTVCPVWAPGQRQTLPPGRSSPYRIERLAAGSYTVTAELFDPEPSRRIERTVSVEVAEGQTVHVDIEMAEAAPH